MTSASYHISAYSRRQFTQPIMSSSYWESTQRKFWTFTKQELALERKRMEDAERNLVNLYPLPDRRHMSIYFSHRT